MYTHSLVVALAVQASIAMASPLFERAVDFYDPSARGGSMLDNAGKYSYQRIVCILKFLASIGSGVGEPLNIIVSGLSSPTVLGDAGFLGFARAIGL
jgi:hypothetical protein